MSLIWLTISIVAAAWSVLGHPIRTLETIDDSLVVLALQAVLAIEFLESLAVGRTFWYWRPGLLLCGCLAIAACSSNRRIHRVAFPALLAAFFLVGSLAIVIEPPPQIDVYMFHQTAADALLHGHNPYAVPYRDIYQGQPGFYGPGIAFNGWLTTGYPYLPLTLLFSILGYALAGDCRVAFIAALTIAAGLIRYSRPGRKALLASLLLLFTPFTFHVIRNAWTEPMLILLLGAVVFAEFRKPGWSPWMLGLLFVSKQYMIVAIPLAILLPSLGDWRDRAHSSLVRWHPARSAIVKVILAGSATLLPFALLDLPRFWRSGVQFHLASPFRRDSLAYSANLADYGLIFPSWLQFAVTAMAIAWVIWRAPRTTMGFCAGCAFVYLVFFSLGKQAFINYYFFPIGALCCAIAACPSSACAGISTTGTVDDT